MLQERPDNDVMRLYNITNTSLDIYIIAMQCSHIIALHGLGLHSVMASYEPYTYTTQPIIRTYYHTTMRYCIAVPTIPSVHSLDTPNRL